MNPTEIEKTIAKAFVQSWDQHIGLDGAIAVINALRAAGYVVIKNRCDPEGGIPGRNDLSAAEG